MLKYKVKRARPNLQTAHEFLRDGVFSISPKEHFLSEAEHDAQVEGIVDQLEEVARQFPKTQNLEFAVLKGHLIIEHVLTQYIRCCSRVAVDVEDIKFMFVLKLQIAYLMGFGANDPRLLPTAQLFNKARNQVAHTFNLDRKVVDELIRINSEPGTPPPASDRQRISALRSICAFTSGVIAGELRVEHHLGKQPKK